MPSHSRLSPSSLVCRTESVEPHERAEEMHILSRYKDLGSLSEPGMNDPVVNHALEAVLS
jgi:hypothetical protein